MSYPAEHLHGRHEAAFGTVFWHFADKKRQRVKLPLSDLGTEYYWCGVAPFPEEEPHVDAGNQTESWRATLGRQTVQQKGTAAEVRGELAM
jgi:hypothetical protein